MRERQKPKGPWISRLAVRFLAVILAILLFWFLGFLVDDIKSIRGPRYDEVEKRYVEQSLVERKETLDGQITDLERGISNRTEEQRIVSDSSKNLQLTINQILDLQKLSIQKNLSLSEAEQSNMTASLSYFLESQKKYQELNASISELTGQKRVLEDERRVIEGQISQQRKLAQAEFDKLRSKHRLKLAFLQLLILVPILLIAVFLIIKKRSSIYFPFFLAFGGAVLVKVGFVIHEYFPTRYFKYILIIALLLAVGRLLIHLIRMVAFPKAQWRVKQYREAYERFLCPICEYPIRIGPRRFLYWTRRTVNKVIPQEKHIGEEEAYICPSCGTALFEKCSSCQGIKHSLLPHCQHCGVEKEIE